MNAERQGDYAGWRRVWIVINTEHRGMPMRFNGGSSYFSTSGGGEIFYERADAVVVRDYENRRCRELGYEPAALIVALFLPPFVGPSPHVRAIKIALSETRYQRRYRARFTALSDRLALADHAPNVLNPATVKRKKETKGPRMVHVILDEQERVSVVEGTCQRGGKCNRIDRIRGSISRIGIG